MLCAKPQRLEYSVAITMHTDIVLTALTCPRTRRLSASTSSCRISPLDTTQLCPGGYELTCHAASCPEDHRRIFADSDMTIFIHMCGVTMYYQELRWMFEIGIVWGTA